MRYGDWFYKADTAPGAYADNNVIDFEGQLTKLKIKAAGSDLTFSWDGKNDHGKIAVADGFQDFLGINKGKIWVKGGGTYELMGWE